MPNANLSTPFSLVDHMNALLGGPMPQPEPPASPMDVATRVLKASVPGHTLAWYHAEVVAILYYNRPERTPIEGAVIRAYRTRQDQIRAGVVR